MKILLVAAVVFGSLLLPATAPAEEPAGQKLSFLVGDWTGTGSGAPGQGTGTFAFQPGLDGRILVRSARSEYPQGEGKPALVHQDLLVVHGDGTRAIYFDNEGHVLHYAVRVDEAARTATFLSEDPGPVFRLTYRELIPGRVRITFEISQTGKSGDFKVYLDGEAMRKNAAGG